MDTREEKGETDFLQSKWKSTFLKKRLFGAKTDDESLNVIHPIIS